MDRDAYYQHLGRRLREVRAAAGLTQLEIAEALGMSRASIANTEAGRQNLGVYEIHQRARICDAWLVDLLPS